MSKNDQLRAMREAKYARAQAAAATRPARATAPVAPAAAPAKAKSKAPAEPGELTEELCGHRNMSGRTCTREKGHAAKSHRYG